LVPIDARITDKSGSLYAIYGVGNPPANPANLRLQIEPHLHIRDLSEVLTHHFRFTLKSTSMGKKQEVELKFEPSGSKEWASLETLTVSARLMKTELQLKFLFQRKEINALKSALTAQSVKKTIEKSFSLNDIIHDFNQRLNKEIVTAGLDSIFEEYRAQGGIFS
jgi:ribosomal protein S13